MQTAVDYTKQERKITEQMEDTIDSLRISMKTDYERFNEAVLVMDGVLRANEHDNLNAVSKWNEAIRRLTAIEDSIKRFRENRPQSFEE